MATKDDQQGLYEKYTVFAVSGLTTMRDGGLDYNDVAPVADCFVMRYKDPHARVALAAYAREVEPTNPTLARDILSKIGQHVEECGDSAGANGIAEEKATDA